MPHHDPHRDALAMVPDLLSHLALSATPTSARRDGQPRVRALQLAPVNLGTLDIVDSVFLGLWHSERQWRELLNKSEYVDTTEMVRVDRAGRAFGVAVVITDPATARLLEAWARRLTNRLLDWWPEIRSWLTSTDLERRGRARTWRGELEAWLWPPLATWSTDWEWTTRRDRACPTCGSHRVVAVMHTEREGEAACRDCGTRVSGDRWVTVEAAAAATGRQIRTVRAWIQHGDLERRRLDGRWHVDLHAAKRVATQKAAARRDGVSTGT